jgi:hypothetical protein
MATVFHLPVLPGWLGKTVDFASHHVVKILSVAIASGVLGGSFGVIILSSAIESGDLRVIIMILPHALLSVAIFTLFLTGIFSLGRRDP